MTRIHLLAVVFILALLSTGCATQHQSAEHHNKQQMQDPSAGASAMPGATGTFSFQPGDWQEGQTTWWSDSDGIAPGVAGCHIGTDADGKPNGRMFGEACLENGRLVESNPGKDELHSHSNDTGHPDTFDCNAWCVGQGKAGGSCVAAEAPPCEASAKCACE